MRVTLPNIFILLFVLISCNSNTVKQKHEDELKNNSPKKFSASFIVSTPLPHGWGYAFSLKFYQLIEGQKPPIDDHITINVGIGFDSLIPFTLNYRQVDTTVLTFTIAEPKDTILFPYELVGFKDLENQLWKLQLKN